MRDTNSPAVDVTIGGQTRIYHAYITTAPATLDGPATLTLYASTFADVIGWAANPIPFDQALGRTPARLVLIGSLELDMAAGASTARSDICLHQRIQYLVSLTTLQHWLWHRLATPAVTEVH